MSLDGRLVGTLPLAAPLRVIAGTVNLEVRAEGHVPVQRRLVVDPGAALRARRDAQAPGEGPTMRTRIRPVVLLVCGALLGCPAPAEPNKPETGGGDESDGESDGWGTHEGDDRWDAARFARVRTGDHEADRRNEGCHDTAAWKASIGS